MNKEKVKLIVKNMELLVQSLKLELDEQEEKNIVSLEDLLKNQPTNYFDNIKDYEPDYYEEEDVDV
jgi:hypothetical protein